MDDRLLAAIVGGWCLIWTVGAAAPAFVGRRRWRDGLPGGRRMVAAAVCGVAPPLFLIGLCIVRSIWPNETPVWNQDLYRWRFVAAAMLLVNV
ncbi:MAG: hypothetical protein AAF907_04605, partial [Planctomycetota bacterium]